MYVNFTRDYVVDAWLDSYQCSAKSRDVAYPMNESPLIDVAHSKPAIPLPTEAV